MRWATPIRCPFCGLHVHSTREENEHMDVHHPDVVKDREMRHEGYLNVPVRGFPRVPRYRAVPDVR